MKTIYTSALILFIFLMAPSGSFADKIIYNLKTTVTVDEQWVTVNLNVSNIGDEDSLVVYPSLKLGEESVELSKKPYIAFGGSSQWAYKFQRNTLGITEKGNYPLYIFIHYHDSNMYPFTRPDVVKVKFGNVESQNFFEGKFKSFNIVQNGLAEISLKSLFPTPLKGKCRLIVPQELSVEPGEKQFSIIRTKPEMISFKVFNHSALAGSSYRIYAVIETDIQEQHRTFFFPAMATISEAGKEFQIQGLDSKSAIIGCFIFLGLLFLASLYIELRK